MADRFPLILNTSANQIQEIASGDTLDLTGNNISNAGVITATSFSGPIVAGAGTSNITAGIITAVTFKGDGDFFDIDVDGDTNLDNVTITGVSTFAGAIDLNSDLDVDGHTNLDNVNVAGVTTFASTVNAATINATTFSGSGASLTGIANANVASNAAIAGSKIAAQFDGQDITGRNINLTHGTPTLGLISNSANPDFMIQNQSGKLIFQDTTNSVNRLVINTDGHIDVAGNLDVGAGIDVTGNSTFVNDLDVDGHTNLDNVSIAGVTTIGGQFTVNANNNGANFRFVNDTHNAKFYLISEGVSKNSQIFFGDAADDDIGSIDYDHAGNSLLFVTNTLPRMTIDGGGKVNISRDLDVDGHTNLDNVSISGIATITGDLKVGGVLTYEDVTNVDSVGIITARNGIKVLAGGANVVGVVTATGGVFVPDNNQIQLGNAAGSADLRIYHQSSNNHSYISETGSGSLIVLADDFYVQDTSTNTMISAKEGAEVNLHFNSNTKLSTTNTGVTVTGNMLATGNVSVNDSQYLYIGNSGDLRMHHDQANTINYINSQNGNLRIQQGGNTLIQLTGTVAKLYGSGSEKLATSNTGITVTGTVAATSYTGDGSNLTGISVGITTEQVTPSSNVATLNLAKDDHKIVASGTYTIDVSGGTEAGSHTLRIENSGTANVGFSTYFKFPSGGTPSLPTASGAISLVSFSVHKVGSVGVATVLLAGASVNFS